MGTLFYGSSRTRVRINDDLLAHVMIVTSDKMRRSEGFFITWTDADSVWDGRSSVWLSSQIEVHFTFDDEDLVEVDQRLVDALLRQASHPLGIDLIDATLVEHPERSPVYPQRHLA